MELNESPNLPEILDLFRQFIDRLPLSSKRVQLTARYASIIAGLGDTDTAHRALRNSAESLRQLDQSLDRAFAEVQVSATCVESGLVEIGRQLLFDAHSFYQANSNRPGMSALLLFIADGFARLGETNKAIELGAQESSMLQAEIVSGVLKRCAMQGRWSEVASLLADRRIEYVRPTLIPEALLMIAEAGYAGAVGDIREVLSKYA